MAHCFSFDGISVANYGCHLLDSFSMPFFSPIDARDITIEGKHGAYALQSYYKPLQIELPCVVLGSSRSDLLNKLQSLKMLFDVIKDEKQLIFDDLSDRYYLAKTISVPSADLLGLSQALISISLACAIPFACAVAESSQDESMPANGIIKTFPVVAEGTVFAVPVWTMTADQDAGSVTVRLKNITTNEEIQWTGTISNGDVLEIDSGHWVVKLNGTGSMATVSGLFPHLQANTSNAVEVKAFHGSLNIKYRNRYL